MMLTVDTPLATVPVAMEAPRMGEKVIVLGLAATDSKNWRTWPSVQWNGVIVGMDDGELLLEGGPTIGSSGACVLNEKGEAIAIFYAHRMWADGGGKVNYAEPIWGGWPGKGKK